MTVNVTENIIKKSYFWTGFKSVAITSKSLSVQYDEDASVYFIYAYDGVSPVYAHTCTIYKGTVPDGVLVSYSQGQNDSDKSDFETNYKNNANYLNVPTASDNSANSKNKNPVLAARANTSAPTWTDGYMVPLSVDTSGAMRVTGSITASNPSVSTNGAAIPSSSTQVGGSDGANLRPILIDSSGRQIVIGAAANGAAVAGNPVLVAGSDGTNARSVRTANDGTVRVDPTGTTTQPVSGTVTANIGTSGSLALDTSVNGILRAQGSTTSGQTGALVQGAVTTAAPTYTTAQTSPLSLTTTGALRIDGSAVTQPVSGTVTANAGTGNFTVVQSTASNLRAQTSSESATAASPPANATYAGGSVTTAAPTYTTGQMNALSLTTAGALRIDGSAVTQPVSGTVTANQGGTWNITNISGTVSLPTGAATETSLAKLTLAQGSTTSGQTGLLNLAAVTTAAPTYTNGQSSPLSLDTTGALRITGSISASNPSVGTNNAAIPTSSTQVGGSDGTNLQAARIFDLDTGGGTQYILGVGLRKAASGGSVELGTSTDPIRVDPTGTTTQPVSGTVTANQGGTWNITNISGTISLPTGAATAVAQGSTTSGQSGTLMQGAVTTANPTYTTAQTSPLSLTTNGLLRTQVWSEALNGAATPNSSLLIGGAVTTAAPTYTTGQLNPFSLTTSGLLRVDGSGVTQPVSGTVAATQSGTWTVQPGNTANTTPWLATISQGGNSAAVKAASTAAAATDPALVVAVSPNNSVAVTQATASNLNAQVVGPGAAAAAISGNPVRIGGSDGTNTRNIITDTTGRQIIVGAAAVAAVPTGNPLLLGEVSPTGNMVNVVGGGEGSILTTNGPNLTVVHSNATLTTSGSTILDKSFYGTQQTSLIVNIKNAPTGTTPTIVFTINEIDPGDLTTVLSTGRTASTTTINTTGTFIISCNPITSSCVKVSWTITGSSPSFTGVYATMVAKIDSNIIASNSTKGIGWGSTTKNTNGLTTVYATSYTEQSSNAQRSVSSSAAADTGAGVGARTVEIVYYDVANSGPFRVTITLNGTTAVNTGVTNICFIESMKVTSTGTTPGSNAGIITLFAATAGGGGAILTIAALANTTQLTHHYIAAGRICNILDLSGSLTGSGSAYFYIAAQGLPFTTSTSVDVQVSDIVRINAATNGGGTVQRNYTSPIQVVGPARVRAYVFAEQAVTSTYYASFTFYEQ